jgi:hypothetical protein
MIYGYKNIHNDFNIGFHVSYHHANLRFKFNLYVEKNQFAIEGTLHRFELFEGVN